VAATTATAAKDLRVTSSPRANTTGLESGQADGAGEPVRRPG
jgi:hypothetical protein